MYSSTCSVLLLFFRNQDRQAMNEFPASTTPHLLMCKAKLFDRPSYSFDPVISLPLRVSLISANLQWPMGICTYVYPLLSRPASVPRSCHWWRTCSVSLPFHFLLVIERLTPHSTLSACFRAEDTAWIIRTNCTELRSYSSRVCRKAQHSTCMHSCCCLDFGVGTGIQAIMHSDTSYIATPTFFFLMSYKWSKSRFS
jgi:hypothetical protein